MVILLVIIGTLFRHTHLNNAVPSPGQYILNMHFFIESSQKLLNSIFNSNPNPQYSFKNYSFTRFNNIQYNFSFKKIGEDYSKFQIIHVTFKPFAKACYKIGIAESAIQSFPKTSRKSLSIGKALFSHSASTIGGYVLNIHFVIELGQNRINSIFNSTLNPEYSLKKNQFCKYRIFIQFF